MLLTTQLTGLLFKPNKCAFPHCGEPFQMHSHTYATCF